MTARRTETKASRSRGYKKKQRTFNQILDAATTVFARKGYEGAAITDIRDEAGIAQGTFYNHFRTKEDVLEELGARASQDYGVRVFATCDRYEDPAERFAVFAKLWLDLARRDPEQVALVARAGERLIPLNTQINAHLMEYLEQGVASGRFQVPADRTTLDIVRALGISGIRLVLSGHADRDFDQAFAALMLRALGLPPAEAERVASRPTPALARDVTRVRVAENDEVWT